MMCRVLARSGKDSALASLPDSATTSGLVHKGRHLSQRQVRQGSPGRGQGAPSCPGCPRWGPAASRWFPAGCVPEGSGSGQQHAPGWAAGAEPAAAQPLPGGAAGRRRHLTPPKAALACTRGRPGVMRALLSTTVAADRLQHPLYLLEWWATSVSVDQVTSPNDTRSLY